MKIDQLVKNGIEEYHKGKFEQALVVFKKCIAKTPLDNRTAGIIYYNIGLCHLSLFNYAAAEKLFQKAVELGNEKVNWELCLSRLHQGNLDGLNLFEHRYLHESKFPDLPIKKIRTLEDLKKANKILVLNEQGFGDEIIFSRGILLLDNKDFSYQVYPEMLSLFQANIGANFFTDRTLSYDFVMKHDYWVPCGDLFKLYVLNHGFDYIAFKPNTDIKKIGAKKRAGICFMSNQKSGNAAHRSIKYEDIKSILTKHCFEWVSLQKDFEFDFAENTEIKTFSDTSDIMDTLDLVVTVETVILPLASVKQKKTIVVYKDYLGWYSKFPFYSNDIKYVALEDLDAELSRSLSK